MNFQIQKEPITCAMKDKVMKDLIQQTIQEKVQPELADIKEDISKRSWQFQVILAVGFAFISLIAYFVFSSPDKVQSDWEDYDKDSIVKMLMLEYRHARSTLKLLPGFPETDAHMERMFVDLDLVYKELDGHHGTEHPLESGKYIFNLMDEHGDYHKRMILSGEHGSGKSSLMSKFAYDWSTNKSDLYISSEKMVFVLDFVKMQPGENLVDAIRNQLLPKVSSKNLMNIIRNYSKQCVFLFDGVNEGFNILSKENPTDVKDMLASKWLQDSYVILTTTPYKLSTFLQRFGPYARIEVKGFSQRGVIDFIWKFFKVKTKSLFWVPSEVGDKSQESMYTSCDLYTYLSTPYNDLRTLSLKHLSKIPMMLTCLCFLWSDTQNVTKFPDRPNVTYVYLHITLSLAKHQLIKNEEQIDDKVLEERIQHVLINLGQQAWKDLQLNMQMNWTDIESDILTDGFELGLLLKHQSRTGVRVHEYFYFIHDIFEDLSIATYFADLAKTNRKVVIENLANLSNEEYRTKFSRDVTTILNFVDGYCPNLGNLNPFGQEHVEKGCLFPGEYAPGMFTQREILRNAKKFGKILEKPGNTKFEVMDFE